MIPMTSVALITSNAMAKTDSILPSFVSQKPDKLHQLRSTYAELFSHVSDVRGSFTEPFHSSYIPGLKPISLSSGAPFFVCIAYPIDIHSTDRCSCFFVWCIQVTITWCNQVPSVTSSGITPEPLFSSIFYRFKASRRVVYIDIKARLLVKYLW